MNALAEELNRTIQEVNPYVFEMLSERGKRFYFPKGILSQSAEAKVKATKFNATIGVAMEDGKAMCLPSLICSLPGIDSDDALLYSSSPGNQKLREAWKIKTLHDNPDLEGVPVSLPIVTSGLSHGLSLLAEIFVNPGDPLIYPDMNWGNYALNYVVKSEAVPCFYPFFDNGGFNTKAFGEALDKYSQDKSKIIVLLNFPNNPSGYTPTDAEGDAIAKELIRIADKGINVVAIIDDAYFGLFFDDACMKQSIFTKLAGKHERLLAIKADAATKEVYVWGLRVGFVSIAVKSAKDPKPLYEAINSKFGGCIRAVISNCSSLSQKLILQALSCPSFYQEREQKVAKMKERALKVHEVLSNPKYDDAWTPYPFNSGYFMCLKLKKVDAEKLRVYLLDKYGVGTISITPTNLRIAFSCLETNEIQDLFDLIHQACQDLAQLP